MPSTSQQTRFASRTVHGIDDAGRPEVITLWIEWQPGGQWGVGRLVNADRNGNGARARDYLFQGFEMADALAAANEALDCDLDVSAADGRNEDVEPFTEDELKRKLERWFFDHR